MKSFAFFTVFLICVNLSLQITQLVNCPPDVTATADDCSQLTCHGPGHVSGKICGEWICQPGKQIGYEEVNNSKVYPECCGGPICAD